MRQKDGDAPARVLLITNDFPPDVGGIERFAESLVERLPAASVLAPRPPGAAAYDASTDITVRRGPGRRLLPGPGTERAFRAAIRTERPDVLLFLSPTPAPLPASRHGLPWAVVCHGAELVLPARLPLLRRLYRHRLRRADALFAVSEYTARHVRALVGPPGPDTPPILRLPNSVDTVRFSPTADGQVVRKRFGLGDAPLIVITGRLVPRKGQDTLIRAMPAVRRAVPDAHLLVVGDGRDRHRLQRLASALPTGAVVFAGRVPADWLPAVYSAADVYAHPNRSRWAGMEQEGFGVVFLEAQASGVAVVAGASGGSAEALDVGRSGLMVEGRDQDEVGRMLAELLLDEARRTRMGEQGRAFVTEHFDAVTVAERLQRDLDALAAGRTPTTCW